MKITHLAILATIVFDLFVMSHTSFADDSVSFAKIDTLYNQTTNTLKITGIVYKTFSQNYVLTIFNPQGRLLMISQMQLSGDDTFSQNISPSNTLWNTTGNYTLKIASGPQILAVKMFYFPGILCCMQNPQGIQADLSKTPRVDSPLKQFKSGIQTSDVQCKEGLHLMIKAEDGSPACVETKDAVNLFERGWAKQIHYYVDKQISHNVYSYMQPKVILSDYSYDGIDKDGVVTINNETYYQTTFNYTVDNLPKESVYLKFQNVTFTFPEGILNTPGGSFVPLDVKFTDGSEEIYGGIVKFSDNVTSYSGISIPTMYGPSIARNSVTVFGNHLKPQAGITIYHDAIKLLVSK